MSTKRKQQITVGFTDTFAPAEIFFTNLLSQRYEVVRDDNNPDYLIFGDGNFGMNNQRYDPSKVTKIFYTGENVRPNWNNCHFALTFDHENSPRHFRLPLWVLEMYSAVFYEAWTEDPLYLKNRFFNAEKEWDRKEKFASFIVSNPTSIPRNLFFNMLSEYKRVDSAGPHMNNVGFLLPRDRLHYKLDYISEFRFNIAFENSSYPGYATEKILNAFYAKTIPIYWGSPTIARDFNPKAFVNVNDFPNFEGAIEYVKHLDSDSGRNECIDMLGAAPLLDIGGCNAVYTDNILDWFETFVISDTSIRRR